MQKSNPQFRGHVTVQEKAAIRRMTLRGVRQSIIARKLKITPPTVSKVQRSFNLPTRLVVPEARIMELFRKGWGGYRIHHFLKVPVNQIYAVAHRNNFKRADGVGYPTPPENEARFIDALKRREDYAKRLAHKYKIGLCKANRLAHEILGCPEFRPGLSKPVLSSNFPQNNYAKRHG
jgi:hypothetical protein